jgi:hypothetical protein
VFRLPQFSAAATTKPDQDTTDTEGTLSLFLASPLLNRFSAMLDQHGHGQTISRLRHWTMSTSFYTRIIESSRVFLYWTAQMLHSFKL